MKSRSLIIAVTLILTASGWSEVAAQRKGLVDVSPDHFRRGVWLEAGLGWGQESYKFADDPYTEQLGKPTFNFAVGGTPASWIRLGGEATAWVNSYQESGDEGTYNVTETLSNVMVVARAYPIRSAGLFFKAGMGLGVSNVAVQYGDGVTETGFATTLGAGYEIQLSKRVFFTPKVEWFQQSYQARGDDTLYERLANLSISVTFQPGR